MSKIEFLLEHWPAGTLKSVSELKKCGYSPQLLKKYRKTNRIELMQRGLYKMFNDEIHWHGLLYCLQAKSETTLHLGGKTALEILSTGILPSYDKKIYFFSNTKENFNLWLGSFRHIYFSRTEVFNYYQALNFSSFKINNYNIRISSSELAIMEMIYLIPSYAHTSSEVIKQTFFEVVNIMGNLSNLRVDMVQHLLENCKSIKVKRLFLCIAEKFNHPWINEIKIDRINLGKGKRLIVQGGVLNKKYNIVIPDNP